MGFFDWLGGLFGGGGDSPDYSVPSTGGGGILGGSTGGGGGSSLAQIITPLAVAAGTAALANLMNGKSGINTAAIDQANAQRSANYNKNFTKIPLIRRGIAALPPGYNPVRNPDPPRFIVQPYNAQQPQSVGNMIPAAGTGGYAAGGIMPHSVMPKPALPHEGILRGPGSGMDDLIPARSGQQEIRLSDGEFVIPADVVSQLGDGSTNAGAKVLHDMMDRVRKQKYGRAQQPRPLPKQGGGILPA